MTSVKRSTRPSSPFRVILLLITIPLFLLAVFLSIRTPSNSATTSTRTSSLHEKDISTTTKVTMGFTKTLLKAGNGLKPKRGQSVTVHCTGFGKNRDLTKKFWSTKDPGQEPFTFDVGLGNVIKGWDESVIDMSLGEVATIHCSPDYAYGAGGFPAW
jgi:FKBP-type peptidyl-prolyl cis-trans isomerase